MNRNTVQKILKIILIFSQLFSGLVFAYVLALTAQEFINYGLFSFVFIVISVVLAFFYLLKGSGFLMLLIVDSLLILVAVLLRLYVLWAYHA